MSNSLRAGTVASPGLSTVAWILATSSICRSVPVNDTVPSSPATSSRLASTGMVWRFSTTPITACRGLSKVSR